MKTNLYKKAKIEHLLKEYEICDFKFTMEAGNKLRINYKIPKKYADCTPYIQSNIQSILNYRA